MGAMLTSQERRVPVNRNGGREVEMFKMSDSGWGARAEKPEDAGEMTVEGAFRDGWLYAVLAGDC